MTFQIKEVQIQLPTVGGECSVSRTSTNNHLSTTATFLANSSYIDSLLDLSTVATSLQWLLSSVIKVAMVVRFNSGSESLNTLFYFC